LVGAFGWWLSPNTMMAKYLIAPFLNFEMTSCLQERSFVSGGGLALSSIAPNANALSGFGTKGFFLLLINYKGKVKITL